jgi:D-alanyl-D-alanine carboxypeptidase/D-alanyl-D-alanine-endopeptidase (penicillin-binding protein 4)
MLGDLANQLANRGIKHLVGPFTVQSAQGDATASYPDAWSPKHRGRRFAPLIGSVTLNENMISFTVGPGTRVGAPVRVIGSAPDGMDGLVDIQAKTISGRRDRLSIRPTVEGRYQVSGTIGIGRRGRTFSGNAVNPRAVLEASWAAALARVGIDWSRAPGLSSAIERGSARQTLAEVVSAPLDSIAHEVNTRSLNLGAEALLRWAAGSTPDAARQLTQHVRDITGDYFGVSLADGSGLSYEDRASPLAFVTYLAKFPSTPAGRNFPLLLPAAGSGTLRKLAGGVPAPGVVHAKTGTLGNASTLVGYLGHKDGMLIISVMYNGPRVYAAKSQQWKLFRTLGAQGTVIPGDSTSVELGGEDVPPR